MTTSNYISAYPASVSYTGLHNVSSPSVAPSTQLAASGSSPSQTLGQANDQLEKLSNDLGTLSQKSQKDFLNTSSYSADASQMAKDISSISDIEKQVGGNLQSLTGTDATTEKAFLADVNETADRANSSLYSSNNPVGGSTGVTYNAGPVNMPLAAAASSASADLSSYGLSIGAQNINYG